jgi:hypothetical protein
MADSHRPRSGLLIIGSNSPLADSLFTFSKDVEFSHCMPGGDETVSVGPVSPESAGHLQT